MTKLISREELLEGGMAGRLNKQASTLLALIENHTAHLIDESRQAASRHLSFQSDAPTSQLFLTAMAQGRNFATSPSVYDLEKYAVEWAVLAPENSSIRAAVAHLLGRKYRFSHGVTPGLRRALGLDTPAVQQAYQALYGQSLTTIYVDRLGLGEQLRWLWTRLASRLENLSPFWTAFALTLTETVGAGILALPITLALVGPLPGIFVLLVFGLVNVLTLIAVTEAITRNGNIRYGYAFFGRLVTDYLGPSGAWLFGVGLIALNALALVAYYTGIATTLAGVTGIPGPVWPLLLLLVTFYVLGQKTLNATVASALLVGGVNLSLILILVLLTIPSIRLENLRYMDIPFVGGRAFDPGALELIFGVVLVAYAGHTSVGNMAKTVLRRDPSGRTLLWGNVAAMLTAMGLYVVWILAVNGALPARTLAYTTSTALIPLATVVGGAVEIFGTLFVLLGMGMASLHFSLALFNQVREWLPARGMASKTSKRSFLHNRVVHFWLGMTPVILICLLNVWLLWTERQSFSRPLGLVGVLAVPLICGVFPILLLVASRRKGDYLPISYWRFLGNPFIAIILYSLFLASLVVHGLIIWQNPVERSVALGMGLVVVVVTLLIWRRGSFRLRLVVELRQLQGSGDKALLAVVDNSSQQRQLALSPTQEEGVTLQAIYRHSERHMQITTNEIQNFSKLTRLHLRLPATRAKELKVWTHQVSFAGDSTAIPVQLTFRMGDNALQYDLSHSDGQIVTPVTGEACQLEIRLLQ